MDVASHEPAPQNDARCNKDAVQPAMSQVHWPLDVQLFVLRSHGGRRCLVLHPQTVLDPVTCHGSTLEGMAW